MDFDATWLPLVRLNANARWTATEAVAESDENEFVLD